jgi:phosphoenolpyruvate-protein kinase (PTS system EI component)
MAGDARQSVALYQMGLRHYSMGAGQINGVKMALTNHFA